VIRILLWSNIFFTVLQHLHRALNANTAVYTVQTKIILRFKINILSIKLIFVVLAICLIFSENALLWFLQFIHNFNIFTITPNFNYSIFSCKNAVSQTIFDPSLLVTVSNGNRRKCFDMENKNKILISNHIKYDVVLASRCTRFASNLIESTLCAFYHHTVSS